MTDGSKRRAKKGETIHRSHLYSLTRTRAKAALLLLLLLGDDVRVTGINNGNASNAEVLSTGGSKVNVVC